MKKLSVKLRVTLWYTFVMIIVSVIAVTAMTSVSYDMIKRDAIERVTQVVNSTSMRIFEPNSPHKPPQPIMLYQRGVHMAVFNGNFELIHGQIPFGITEKLDFSDNHARLKSYDGNHYYVYDKQIKIQGTLDSYWVKGFISVTEENYAINSVMKNNILLTLVLILMAAVGGYIIISRAFVPVGKISRTAKEISQSSDLSQRINIGDSKDEISELANTFDQMLDKIEQSFESEKQFTSDASHELRTPVAVIMSECEYVEDCVKTIDEAKESVRSIERQTEKMSKLISELLTISRMDKNTIKANFEKLDISELLSFVCEEQQEINDNGINLICNIKPNVVAMADRSLLARLFINLISNAYQYSKPDGNIWVSLDEGENLVNFTVRDDGIGIPSDKLDKIWERFYRVDTARTATDSSNSGLGLSMVKWIANLHKGSISVKSELGESSEFEFSFPKNI